MLNPEQWTWSEMMRKGCLAMIILVASVTAQAMAAEPDPASEIAALQASVPAANQADVGSETAIVDAIYATISGPPGQRDWARFHSLMLPEARFTTSSVDGQGRQVLRRRSLDDYIERAQQFFSEHGFYESGLVSKVERFGNIAQVFSSYESRTSPEAKPFQRGINAIQVMYDGSRWWVVSVLWDSERPDNQLPKAMTR